jgi:hypothetical protein
MREASGSVLSGSHPGTCDQHSSCPDDGRALLAVLGSTKPATRVHCARAFCRHSNPMTHAVLTCGAAMRRVTGTAARVEHPSCAPAGTTRWMMHSVLACCELRTRPPPSPQATAEQPRPPAGITHRLHDLRLSPHGLQVARQLDDLLLQPSGCFVLGAQLLLHVLQLLSDLLLLVPARSTREGGRGQLACSTCRDNYDRAAPCGAIVRPVADAHAACCFRYHLPSTMCRCAA